MLEIAGRVKQQLAREEGQNIVEYGVVLGLVALPLVAILVGSGLADGFEELAQRVVDALIPE